MTTNSSVYVETKCCSKCFVTKPLTDFVRYRDGSSDRGGYNYQSICKKCNSQRVKLRRQRLKEEDQVAYEELLEKERKRAYNNYHKDIEKARAYVRNKYQRYARDPFKRKAILAANRKRSREYYLKNKERILAYSRDYYHKHRENIIEYNRQYRRRRKLKAENGEKANA